MSNSEGPEELRGAIDRAGVAGVMGGDWGKGDSSIICDPETVSDAGECNWMDCEEGEIRSR